VAYNLYKKLGFVDEGIKRQEVLKNGVYVDSVIMSMLRSELLINKKL
jgi:RimJ/RimL family protein N-acetyltransferase